jgi:hypothetical protein
VAGAATATTRAGAYFLLTFTLPAEFRTLAWSHQRILYDALMQWFADE